MTARTSLRVAVSSLAITLAMTSSLPAFAGDTAVAEQLFGEGLKAMERRDYKAACDAFQGSMEADPSPGTLINLAVCHEKQGKLASAWGEYRTAAGMAEQRGQNERVEIARKAAAKLEPQLHKLVISIAGAKPEGLVVKRDGVTIPSATYDREIPIDPGEHVLEATAKGKQPFTRKISVASNNATDRLEIALVDAPVDAPPPGAAATPTTFSPPADTGGSDGTSQRNIGYLVGGAGIIALGVAGGLQLLALSVARERDDLADKRNPPNVNGCGTPGEPTCPDLEDSINSKQSAADGNQLAAIVVGASGAVAIGVGVALVLTAPSRRSGLPRILPVWRPGYAGIGAGMTF